MTNQQTRRCNLFAAQTSGSTHNIIPLLCMCTITGAPVLSGSKNIFCEIPQKPRYPRRFSLTTVPTSTHLCRSLWAGRPRSGFPPCRRAYLLSLCQGSNPRHPCAALHCCPEREAAPAARPDMFMAMPPASCGVIVLHTVRIHNAVSFLLFLKEMATELCCLSGSLPF